MILTDRSRYVAGLDHCMRRRYLEYAAHGGGFRPKAQDIFLSTGSALHKALEGLLKAEDTSREGARGYITSAIREYRDSVALSGLSGAVPEEYLGQSQVVVDEQACLVEGLYWCFYLGLLPWLLESFEIVAVEQEEWKITGCGCGLGDAGEIDEHEERQCPGVVIMSRPDFVAMSKLDQTLSIWDFKSTGYELDSREHEHLLQVVFGSLGVERRYGKPCTSHYFIGLHKGVRRESKGEAIKKQSSPLCYGYLRPAAGMLDPGDWKSSYEWEEGGKTRRVTKDYLKTPVWEAHFREKEEGISNVEHLVFSQGVEFAQAQVSYLGPSQRPEWLVPKILRQVVAHEWEWVERVKVAQGGDLDEAVPCSWDCYPYGRPCAYQDICFESPGHERPMDSPERWERRVPHHALELEREQGR